MTVLYLRQIAFVAQKLSPVMDDLEAVLAVFDRLTAPLVHVVGNHCLEVPRAELLPRLGLERGHRSRIEGDWRFLLLEYENDDVRHYVSHANDYPSSIVLPIIPIGLSHASENEGKRNTIVS